MLEWQCDKHEAGEATVLCLVVCLSGRGDKFLKVFGNIRYNSRESSGGGC